MNAKVFILEQLEREKNVVEHLLVKKAKWNLDDVMARPESLRSISRECVQIVRWWFHENLVSDPYYLSPKRQKISSLYSEFNSIVIARNRTITKEHRELTSDLLWKVVERGCQANNNKELNPTVSQLEVQAIREIFIQLLTGKVVDPVVNK